MFARNWLLLAQAALLALLTGQALGHEMRPAFLQINEATAGEFQVLWKQPVLDDRRLPLEPLLPEGCELTESAAPERTADALLQTWQTQCSMREGELRIDGLTKTLTDVMVRIRYADGEVAQHMLRPDSPAIDLAEGTPYLTSYLIIGVEHLLFGIDHILFVIGLVLYIKGFWPLVKTITSFTIAHSITLGLAVVGAVQVPQAPVEAIIALSIVFLARELMLPESQRSPLTQQRPWLMAFAFGLLHGFGFAGALSDIGLPREDLAVALLLFNLGLELGQLLVVFAVLALAWLAAKLYRSAGFHTTQPSQLADQPALAINPSVQLGLVTTPLALVLGCVAAYWTIERVLGILI